jgi:GH25 family lysozyme M1 (1,4-beta-N-acetylmuramidase)
MALKGIDVSYSQGSINWAKVKSQIDFAILRSTFGSDLPSQTDSQFHQNANGCVKNNIPFGIYHFGYFVDE